MSEPRSDVIVIDAIDPPPLKYQRRARRVLRWPARSLGAAATVLIHVLLCSPLILGSTAHRKKPTPDGIGTTAWASQGEQSESMILLDLSSMSTGPQLDLPKIDASELAIELEQEQLRLVSSMPMPEPDVLIEEEAEEADEASEAAGDPSGRAELFGKYMGHVAARIDRAWMRPRTPLEGGRFECRVRIVQNRQGFVLSVNLDDCGGDAKWRDSLTSAILRASPLSAPPEPWLFTESLTLQFAADQYEAGRTAEYLYEPAPLKVAMNQPVMMQQRLNQVGVAPAQSPVPTGGDVDLTITGNKVEWKKR